MASGSFQAPGGGSCLIEKAPEGALGACRRTIIHHIGSRNFLYKGPGALPVYNVSWLHKQVGPRTTSGSGESIGNRVVCDVGVAIPAPS